MTAAEPRARRYFLSERGEPEREVGVREYVNAEKRAGFRGAGHLEDPPRPACSSFASTKPDYTVRGRTA